MQVAWTIAVGGILGLWFVASVIHQAPPRWWMHVKKFDRLRLLPRWNFFAPRPGRRDQHLVIRDIVDDVPGPWREVETGDSPPLTRWVVNPRRFRQKALIDLINRFLAARREFAERGLDASSEQLSAGYVAILAWVVAQPAAVRPCLRQFAVVATDGHGRERDLHLLYISAIHTLEEDECVS